MDPKDLAHLLRRTEFAAPPERVQALAGLTREAAVDQILNFEGVNNTPMEKALKVLIRNDQDFNVHRRWWFARMILTQAPFQEKMTLFWHNHFATSDLKAFAFTVAYQNLTLRSLALAKFDDLLLAVAQDPGMIFYLDNFFSTKDRPNENWARELMELFTMGISGPDGPNYTENDVKEVARAFTGWSALAQRSAFGWNPRKPNPFRFNFVDSFHDHGNKTVFNLPPSDIDGTDVVKILAARPATARFLVKKLFAFFVFPLNLSDPQDAQIIDQFAQVYLDNDHSIKTLVASIFKSDVFFSDRARWALVKNPVDLIVGAIRMLNAAYQDSGGSLQDQPPLYQLSARMGMNLDEPDDVSGWGYGLRWIGSSTLLERYNFANSLMSNRSSDLSLPDPFVSNDKLKQHTKANAADTVASFLNVLGPLEVDQETVDRLTNYLETDDQGHQVGFTPDDQTIDRKVRGLVRHIMYLAEFQLI
jgi:uncharacterized protein (DUF1800 family)